MQYQSIFIRSASGNEASIRSFEAELNIRVIQPYKRNDKGSLVPRNIIFHLIEDQLRIARAKLYDVVVYDLLLPCLGRNDRLVALAAYRKVICAGSKEEPVVVFAE